MDYITLIFAHGEHRFLLRFPPTEQGASMAYYAIAAWRTQGYGITHEDCLGMFRAVSLAVSDWHDAQHVMERMG